MLSILLIGSLAQSSFSAGLATAYLVSIAQQRCCVRPQDQIWLVSTRRMGRNANPCSCSIPNLAYFQYRCSDATWCERSECEFMATIDPLAMHSVFVHGNRQRARNVENRGFQAYCLFKQCASDRPIRHVIWEWPSMPIPCRAAVVRDGRVKLRRTPAQSYYLGWWLSQLPPELDVRMLGYSYGCRTILGSLHLLAGCELNCRRLPCSKYGGTVTPRVALWAAATQGDWLCGGRPHECALSKTECCLNIYNCNDPVLGRLERLMFSFTGPPLGLLGVNAHLPLQQFNATCDIGRRHDIDFYFQSCRVMNCTRQFLGLCAD